jgi:hypothetical protein
MTDEELTREGLTQLIAKLNACDLSLFSATEIKLLKHLIDFVDRNDDGKWHTSSEERMDLWEMIDGLEMEEG